MKIETKYYGFFTKSNGKWSKSPYKGELITKDDITYGSCIDENVSFGEHLKAYKKNFRNQVHKKVKLMRQIWKSV